MKQALETGLAHYAVSLDHFPLLQQTAARHQCTQPAQTLYGAAVVIVPHEDVTGM
jgi:hypothetical protein